jgi:hypothetical protein
MANTTYATLAEFKEAAGILSSDTVSDTALQDVLNTSAKMVDRYCDTAIGFGQTSSQTRYYQASKVTQCLIDPLVSISQLATDNGWDGTFSTVWSATDYIFYPRNAAADSMPYYWMDANLATGAQMFPLIPNGVKVTGVFGWPAVPAAVKQATIIQALALFSSRQAPFGVIGAGSEGSVMRMSAALHPEVKALLEPYRLRGGIGF